MDKQFPLPVGTFVRTMAGEMDRDQNDEMRRVEAKSIGRVVRVEFYAASPDGERYHHHVVFKNGCWVTLYEKELIDPKQYEVIPCVTKYAFVGFDAGLPVINKVVGRQTQFGSVELWQTRIHAFTGYPSYHPSQLFDSPEAVIKATRKQLHKRLDELKAKQERNIRIIIRKLNDLNTYPVARIQGEEED